MTYQQTIDYLYSRLPMFSRTGAAAYKKDITNTVALCKALQQPHLQFKSIHVAGTNGKGSVSHMLAAVLQQAGYKTGLYTSPHLFDFRERIRINGRMVPEAFVVAFTQEVQPLIAQIEPSFFELSVAMAFSWFALQQVDVAVIETGLGGRLDSTNIITPELSIITNIGWDHMNLLGNSLEQIAGEKAGIIKPGIPAVIGERQPETTAVFEAAAQQQKAPLYFAADAYQITAIENKENLLRVLLTATESGREKEYLLDLTGRYQAKNLRTVCTALDVLRMQGWHLPDAASTTALQQVQRLTGFMGRWQVLQHNPLVVLDVAHNTDGMRQVLEQLQHLTYNTLHIITGMVRDKDVRSVVALLPQQARYYFTQAHIPRALPAAELQQLAATCNRNGHTYAHVNEALREALQNAQSNDVVLVCGSVFLVGEVDLTAFRTGNRWPPS
ncbi:MAG: bifunctional folylpolyglutamate synthase/dihydrofolate synthase [Lacibacter sp.]